MRSPSLPALSTVPIRPSGRVYLPSLLFHFLRRKWLSYGFRPFVHSLLCELRKCPFDEVAAGGFLHDIDRLGSGDGRLTVGARKIGPSAAASTSVPVLPVQPTMCLIITFGSRMKNYDEGRIFRLCCCTCAFHSYITISVLENHQEAHTHRAFSNLY